MSLQSSRNDLVRRVLDHLWNAWTELGIAGAAGSAGVESVLDPEALLAATMSFGRWDARLFDEVIDWLTVNGDLINVPRLNAMMKERGFDGRSALTAVAEHLAAVPRLRPRWKAIANPEASDKAPARSFFRSPQGRSHPKPRSLDSAFKRAGFLRESPKLRGLSHSFPMHSAPAILLRLRALLGMTSRCELLCILAANESVNGRTAGLLAGYAPRTTQDALADMARSGFVDTVALGREARFSLVHGAAAGLLPSPALRFEPSAAIYATLTAMLHHMDEVIEAGVDDVTAATHLRRLLSPHREILARFGVFRVLPTPETCPAEEYLDALDKTVDILISRFGQLSHLSA